MIFAPLLLAAVLAQPAQATPPAQAAAGRLFISPMGEPFRGRTPGEDGLVVWFQQADRNHDGYLTLDEMEADAARFFKVLDRNHDGEIDPDDITYYEEVIAPQLRVQPVVTATAMPGGDTEEHVDDESSAGKLGLLQIPEPVASADRDFDRGVSPEEFRAAADARFQLLDTNHTGKLSLADLQAIRRAAGSIAERRRNGGSNPADNPTSAEYGQPAPQP